MKKWCWIAKELPHGLWTVSLAVGNKQEYPLKGLEFGSEKDVKKLLNAKGKIVFVHYK